MTAKPYTLGSALLRGIPLRSTPLRATLMALAIVWTAGGASGAALEVGAAAPDFSLAGSDGEVHTLKEHRGKRGVVLAWFPKAFTPG